MTDDELSEKLKALVADRCRAGELWSGNWCTALDNSIWNIDGDHDKPYINGILSCIDFDYEVGYLCQIVWPEPDQVRYWCLAFSPWEEHEGTTWLGIKPTKFFEQPGSGNAWLAIDLFQAWYRKLVERPTR